MKLAIFCALVQAEHKIQAKGSLCDCSIEKRKALYILNIHLACNIGLCCNQKIYQVHLMLKVVLAFHYEHSLP